MVRKPQKKIKERYQLTLTKENVEIAKEWQLEAVGGELNLSSLLDQLLSNWVGCKKLVAKAIRQQIRLSKKNATQN